MVFQVALLFYMVILSLTFFGLHYMLDDATSIWDLIILYKLDPGFSGFSSVRMENRGLITVCGGIRASVLKTFHSLKFGQKSGKSESLLTC